MQVNQIVPKGHENDPEVFDQLRAEYAEHMRRAQELYERALEAHVTGATNRDLLFRQAIIEQNAALLCQGELNGYIAETTFQVLLQLLDAGDEEEPLAAGGDVQ